jgi:Uma2 family endonuclease
MSDAPVLTQQRSTPSISDESVAGAIDPYPYGWRDLEERLPNGEYRWTRIPLTLEDVLHPQEEDVLLPTEEHERFRNYLYSVMLALVSNDPTAVVLSDTNIAGDVPTIKPHRPDLAVIFGVRERRNWSTFVVAEEGVRPSLIIEITSPKTRHLDLDNKFDEYEAIGIPCYVIIDIRYRKRAVTRELKGYVLTPDGYAPLMPNEQGWLWLEPVSVWLAITGGAVVCYDRDGNRIEDYVGVTRARRQAMTRAAEAEARAAEEARARIEAERRAAELETRLRALEAELRRREQKDAE